ncbi:beta/gamma crystallin domain-containing protein [Kitasatospora sp. NPDC101155]|uniref:beta/gamma crystallin domain-containing protein n=1 Tax=Kitasatospora sp. NPDC101155 TaxID=3364097 RepID=UPI00381C1F29
MSACPRQTRQQSTWSHSAPSDFLKTWTHGYSRSHCFANAGSVIRRATNVNRMDSGINTVTIHFGDGTAGRPWTGE